LTASDLVVGSSEFDAPALRTDIRRKLTAVLVEKLRENFEAGDAGALLDAIDFCARAGMAMPLWVVDAYGARHADWRMFRAATLDDAFDVKRKKGMHLEDAKRREWLKPRVAFEVELLRRSKNPPPQFDDVLFARVGKKLGISRAQANKIYYAADNNWREFLPRFQSLLRKPEFS
jgi:hypothetical protein